MKTSKKHRSKEGKLEILREARENGVTKTLEKYGIYRATYYTWKCRYDQMGEEGLAHSMTKERLKRIGELEQENELLKQLLAEKELESKLKDELLKKGLLILSKGQVYCLGRSWLLFDCHWCYVPPHVLSDAR